MKGKFIIFEGMDLSGKTTTLRLLADVLSEKGIPYVITREPGGSILAERIREILLSDSTINEQEQAMLFQTARSHHSRTFIKPNLDKGVWVLSDRYIVSSMVYQNSQVAFFKKTAKDLDLAIPDQMVYAKCGYETTLRRKGIRTDNNHLDDLYTKNYHRYSALFDKYANQAECKTLKIDTNNSTELIRARLVELVNKLIGEHDE